MKRIVKWFALFLTLLFSLVLTSCLTDNILKIPFLSYMPLYLYDGWEIGKPAKEGIDEEALTEIYKYVHEEDNLWQIRSLLVVRNGKLVAESYMKNPDDRTNLHPVWSNTKQFTGVLAGIAVDQGLIAVNDFISDHLPQVSQHPEKSRISIENLLMMKSGINYDNDKDDDKVLYNRASNYLDFILGLDMRSSPGSQFYYNDADPHLISVIIQEKTGKPMGDWAKEVLFDKIGINNLEWLTYDGITVGAFGILTTPREMAKLGQLVLNEGKWGTEQIVSHSWINEMTSEKVPANETHETDIAFGYLWWKDTARNVMFMWGHGGQFVFINKDKNLIMVMTSEPHTNGEFVVGVHEALSIYDRINHITD